MLMVTMVSKFSMSLLLQLVLLYIFGCAFFYQIKISDVKLKDLLSPSTEVM